MWFLSHNRHGSNWVSSYTKAIFSLWFFWCAGCTQLPKFQTTSPHASNAVAVADADIPVPVFSNAQEDLRGKDNVLIASALDGRGLVEEVVPFEWKPLATSAGGRKIEGVTVGQGGYRTLILGSLAGDDPLAIKLTEELAEHIHANSIILGGIAVTVIRNTNPDGQANFRMENANGVYLNRQFPLSKEIPQDLLQQEPEVRFLLGLFEERQPQRVIHIRTCAEETGLIAASSGASRVAKDACEWLGFEFIELPGQSASGTLERFLAIQQACEIITIAIPQKSNKAELWETYGDSILNLLLDEDYETRKLARTQKVREFADRRIRNSDNSIGSNDD